MNRRTVLLLATSALALAACGDNFSFSCGGSCAKKGSPYPLAFYAPDANWYFAYSVGMTNPMAKDANGKPAFDFPVYPGAPQNGAGVHYVVTKPSGLAVGKTITMTFKLEGTGRLYPTDPSDKSPVAIMRLFIERNGDHLSEEFYRWWANSSAVTLDHMGAYTVTAKISGEGWGSVFGKSGTDPAAANGFADAVANAGNVGFTFGGQFAGHGNGADGPVHFTLDSFTIQ